VKILFDVNTPYPLARYCAGHEISRASEMGWAAISNGELVRVAEQAGFDALVSCDQNLRYQQNIQGRRIGIVILNTNHWPSIRPVASKVASRLEFMQRVQFLMLNIEDLK
jgi:hypothetical protein